MSRLSLCARLMAGLEISTALHLSSAQAHRLVCVREEDWGYQAVRIRDDDTEVWLNTVGTFGMSPAAYWWQRATSLG